MTEECGTCDACKSLRFRRRFLATAQEIPDNNQPVFCIEGVWYPNAATMREREPEDEWCFASEKVSWSLNIYESINLSQGEFEADIADSVGAESVEFPPVEEVPGYAEVYEAVRKFNEGIKGKYIWHREDKTKKIRLR